MADATRPRQRGSQPAPRTFVLVHGAWHGGWCWRRVADLLHAQGHKVFAPTLSGLAERSHLLDAGLEIGLETHVTDVANLWRWEGLSEVVLCGHSYGGMVISGVAERLAAEPGAIGTLVFLDAFVPADGERMADLASPAVRDAIAKVAARGASTIPPVPAAVFQVNEQDRAWVDAKCTPQPLATLTDRIALTGARERIANKVYVRAAGYPSAPFDATGARLAGDPGWRVLEVPCGHDAMVDMPERLAEILAETT
jgi:pimeloyl-ACP methyl ester carboxylesterase